MMQRTLLQKFTWISNASGLALLAYLTVYILFDPAGFEPHLAKDSPYGAGAMEELTWIFLLIGILTTLIWMFRLHRKNQKLPDVCTKAWLICWFLISFPVRLRESHLS